MIILEIKKTDMDCINELLSLTENVTLCEPRYWDGAEVFQLLVELTEKTLPIIASLIIANRNNNKITIKKNGIDITLTLNKYKNINELIDKLTEED